ncbi:hypothetical protein M0R45_030375 [Rubus argutus]|uniref:Uncharacterized protein n=1 Tax=Rubus argutus TaxID=59490 RepID=A0AAW1WDF4_RUBAR
MDELKNNNEANPAHVASLLIMSLFVSFLFSNSASKITWDLVNVTCKVKDISSYNWSLIVIQFLEKGLTKHKKDKPVTLSGCLLLILYWFLDNTKAKRCIAGRERAKPTFTKWSIQNIFDWQTYKSNPRLAEQWIEDGPWDEPKQKTIDLNEDIIDLDDDDDVDMTAPTFSQWVSQATQDNRKEATQAAENLRSLIQSLEESVDGKPTSKQ